MLVALADAGRIWPLTQPRDNPALNENDHMPFQESVSFAIEVYPGIRQTISWRGMQLRGLLGYRVVNSVLSVMRSR